MSAIEEWRPVVGYEGEYEVSNHGRVRSLTKKCTDNRVRKGRILSGRSNGRYPMVSLWRGNEGHTRLVHHLVLEAFVGLRPEGFVGCHWDDNPRNNYLSNLRWDTPTSNSYDSVRNGNHHNAEKDACIRGHLLAGPNLYETARQRACKSCRNARMWLYYRKRKRIPTEGKTLDELSDEMYQDLIGRAHE